MLSETEKTSQYWDPLNHYYHHQVHDLHSNPGLQQPRLKGDRPTKVATHTHEEAAQLLKVVRRKGATQATGKAKIVICERDGVVSRVCADCNTSKTPLWRSGPAGPKSLCNACGIRYRKRRRRGLDFLNVGRSMLMKERKRKEKVLYLLQWKLEEETEAAVLLMALSCGLFVHT